MSLSFSAEQIAAVVNGEVRGDKNVTVSDVSPIEDAREGTLCFINDEKFLHFLTKNIFFFISFLK